MAEILNQVSPEGNYKETDHFEFHPVEKGVKKSPIAKLFTKTEHLVRSLSGLLYSVL